MRTPEPSRSRRKPGENRERLLEAGLIEFGLFGYFGASTASIAARAQVPQPHVYASFSAKRELFVACVSRACEAIEEVLEAERDDAGISADSSGLSAAEIAGPLRVLLQAVSAVRDAALRTELEPMLRRLRVRAGDRRFTELLAAASDALLNTQGE